MKTPEQQYPTGFICETIPLVELDHLRPAVQIHVLDTLQLWVLEDGSHQRVPESFTSM